MNQLRSLAGIMMNVFRTLTLLSVLSAFCRALSASGAGAIAEETGVSLDETWRIQPAGGEEREIGVPGFWERSRGLANVHEACPSTLFRTG